jgi:exonuclease VII small subunit
VLHNARAALRGIGMDAQTLEQKLRLESTSSAFQEGMKLVALWSLPNDL